MTDNPMRTAFDRRETAGDKAAVCFDVFFFFLEFSSNLDYAVLVRERVEMYTRFYSSLHSPESM